jgi:hypothetical protein
VFARSKSREAGRRAESAGSAIARVGARCGPRFTTPSPCR